MSEFRPSESDPTPPRPVVPLDYGVRRYGEVESNPLRTIGHFFAGVGAWGAALATAWIAVNLRVGFLSVASFLFVALFVLLGLGAALSQKCAWRAFTPGVLVGAAMTCLVPVGIIAAMCGGMRI